MNERLEQRLRKLEQQQERERQPKKQICPQWMMDRWHEETGLPFDTEENARDSIQRMLQPEYREARRNKTATEPH